MENKKNIIIGILIFLLLCVVGICIYLVVDKSNSVVDNEKEQTENKIEELDVNDELVQNLYKKIDVFDNYLSGDYFGYIFKDKLTYKDIENGAKLYIAFVSLDTSKYMDDKEYFHIPDSEMEKSLKDIFGDVNYTHEAFHGTGEARKNGSEKYIKYDAIKKEYHYSYPYIGCTFGCPVIRTKLTNAIKNDKDIELYQLMVYEEHGSETEEPYSRPCYYIYENIGGYKIDGKCVDSLEDYDVESWDEQYKDKLDTYKYTFKYNEEDDKYYFYSVERIQK